MFGFWGLLCSHRRRRNSSQLPPSPPPHRPRLLPSLGPLVTRVQIGLNTIQRDMCALQLEAMVEASPLQQRVEDSIGSINFSVDLKTKPAEGSPPVEIDASKLERLIYKSFDGQVRAGQGHGRQVMSLRARELGWVGCMADSDGNRRDTWPPLTAGVDAQLACWLSPVTDV